jgi:hypothetical protein
MGAIAACRNGNAIARGHRDVPWMEQVIRWELCLDILRKRRIRAHFTLFFFDRMGNWLFYAMDPAGRITKRSGRIRSDIDLDQSVYATEAA